LSPRHAVLVLLLAALPLGALPATAVRGKPVKAALAHEEAAALRVATLPAALERAVAWPALQASSKTLQDPEDKRMRVGIARDAAGEASTTGDMTWIALPDGGRVAHLRATSPGAAALRVGLAFAGPLQGLELRVADARGNASAGVSTAVLEASMRQQGVYWTPASEGDVQVVELWLPASAAGMPRVAVTGASHLLGAPSSLFKSASGASQGCEENVACIARSNPALTRAASAVAKLLYTENGVTYLCTGTLVSDSDGASQVPYLLTAAHCIGSQAAAASLNTFWFFQSASCDDKDAAAYKQLSGGASLLFADAATDIALVRLHEPAPQGAWFAGWDAQVLPSGAPVISLHHPGGDVKKISLGEALGAVGTPPSSYTGVAWTAGTTEGGSSGSGLFTLDGDDYVLRGALRGGSASCTSSGHIADPANRDYYSRLDLAAATLAKWLTAASGPLDDYSGLWFDPDEPGWGLSIMQDAQDRVLATWFAYDAESRPTWLVMPAATWTRAGAFEGALYRARGSAFELPYDPSAFAVLRVGMLRVQFTVDGTASASFEVDGRTVVKTMRRQPL
jgi:lysyl endopeptidase